jgi:hypothetical protein
MPRGRRPGPGTAEEKAALRRERVRLNVQAFRKRKNGASNGQEPKAKLGLRWVCDSKWQTQYDEIQQHSEESVDEDDDAVRRTNTPANPSTVNGSTSVDAENVGQSLAVLPNSPNLGRQYSYALLASLPARFLPHRVSIPSVPDGYINIRTPCALWVTSACSLAQASDSGPLKDTLLSIVVALAAQEQNRPDLTITSQRLYTRGLTKTRRLLQPIIDLKQIPQGVDLAGVFLACHAASVYELFINGSLEDMARHVTGIGLFIKHLQARSDIYGLDSVIGDSLLEEYRMLQMNFSMLARRPSTIHMHSIKINHSKKTGGSSIFTDLLDLADQVPPIMLEIDRLRSKQQSHPSDCEKTLNQLIPVLLNIHAELRAWSNTLREKLVEKSLGDIFAPDEVTIDLAAINSYEFAATWMFTCSYDCYGIETCVEALELLASLEQSPGTVCMTLSVDRTSTLRSDLVANAGAIVEIIPYFLQPDKGIIGRSIAIWPLEGAWSALENEERRLRRDEAELERTNADIEIKINLEERKVQVMKYLKLCQQGEGMAKSFGLPMFKQR